MAAVAAAGRYSLVPPTTLGLSSRGRWRDSAHYGESKKKKKIRKLSYKIYKVHL